MNYTEEDGYTRKLFNIEFLNGEVIKDMTHETAVTFLKNYSILFDGAEFFDNDENDAGVQIDETIVVRLRKRN